jgi:hypothetical protein
MHTCNSQLLRRLRQDDHLSSGVQDQLGQHSNTLSHKISESDKLCDKVIKALEKKQGKGVLRSAELNGQGWPHHKMNLSKFE